MDGHQIDHVAGLPAIGSGGRFVCGTVHRMQHAIDVPALHRRIRSMLEDAGRFIRGIPSDAVGVVFLDGGKPVQPSLERMGKYQRHAGAPGGVWPSSPEISTAMLERYGDVP